MKIPVVRDVLEESNALAVSNRKWFDAHETYVVNVMSSPGAGKTTLLSRVIKELCGAGLRCGVIEGDITTTLDSEKLATLEIPIVQVNTEPFGGDCHVGSHLVSSALKLLPPEKLDFLFIENIGNLVCPAEFYLGEHAKIVVLSLPEGEDKPLKYPLMFRECVLCLLNKVDLIPFLDVDPALFVENMRRINGALEILPVSGKTGAGIDAWTSWLMNRRETYFHATEMLDTK